MYVYVHTYIHTCIDNGKEVIDADVFSGDRGKSEEW